MEGLVDAIHLDSSSVGEPKGKAAILRRTSGGTPLDTLIRLFILGVDVDLAAAAAATAPMTTEEWAALGLLAIDGDRATATVMLRCFGDFIVASDFSRRPWADGLRPDYVMGISLSTLTLAGLAVRPRSRATLDLGTGSGFHAFMATEHSDQVVAVDRNPRAVRIASFNAALNGLDNVECLEGDLFEPVRDRRFDLIVSNPPFIISPESTHYFLHSGLHGDDVCQRIVREAPTILEDGGICQLLANWVIPAGGDWRGRLESWFSGIGCDGFVLERGREDPESYAAQWIETAEVDAELIRPVFDRWLTYFEERGIEGVGTGLITLRKRSGRDTWFRIAEAPERIAYPAGDEILRTFAILDFLDAVTDAELLDSAVQLAPEVQLAEESIQQGGRWAVQASHLRRTKGFEYSGRIDAQGAALLAACDGRTPLRDLAARLSVEAGVDAEQVARGVAGIIRELMERGFVLPAPESGGQVRPPSAS